MTTTCSAERHGTADAYRHARCRCDTARKAMSLYEKRRHADILAGRPRTLPNTGALRRLHALRALGWPTRELAARIGVDERNIARWPHRRTISRQLHQAICRVYDDLADTPGPDERARRHAARQGWLPPLWWDDDTIDDPTYTPSLRDTTTKHDLDPVAVDRACAGQPPLHLTVAERNAAVERLAARGYSDAEIGAVLGTSRDAIAQRRHRHGVPAAIGPRRTAGVA